MNKLKQKRIIKQLIEQPIKQNNHNKKSSFVRLGNISGYSQLIRSSGDKHENIKHIHKTWNNLSYGNQGRSLLSKADTVLAWTKQIKLENVFMKHYAPNYRLVSKQNISLIKAKPKSKHTFVTQWHQLSEHK